MSGIPTKVIIYEVDVISIFYFIEKLSTYIIKCFAVVNLSFPFLTDKSLFQSTELTLELKL